MIGRRTTDYYKKNNRSLPIETSGSIGIKENK